MTTGLMGRSARQPFPPTAERTRAASPRAPTQTGPSQVDVRPKVHEYSMDSGQRSIRTHRCRLKPKNLQGVKGSGGGVRQGKLWLCGMWLAGLKGSGCGKHSTTDRAGQHTRVIPSSFSPLSFPLAIWAAHYQQRSPGRETLSYGNGKRTISSVRSADGKRGRTGM